MKPVPGFFLDKMDKIRKAEKNLESNTENKETNPKN